jgi:hypothetical protein
VTTSEFYYLILVIGAFGTFAVALSVASAEYRASQRREEIRLRIKGNRR